MATPAVELIAVGNELLLGETVDTNAAWIARCLADEGITVARKTTVSDGIADISDALHAALRRSRTVICTGGLGPTPDDLTRHALAAVYRRDLVIDQGWIDVLHERYARRGMSMPPSNRVQAEHPAGARLLPNEQGSAPGIALADDALGLTILLPGVPSEMRHLMETQVMPLLRAQLHGTTRIASRMLRTAGIAEAALAERIADIAAGITAPLSLAFLPQTAGVDLRVTYTGDAAGADVALDPVLHALRDRLGTSIYADAPIDLAAVLGGMLRARGLTLALAESCTGGLVCRRMTDEGGASDFMLAGFVTYSNRAKQDTLGVRAETIGMHGAVSEQCAREMAEGARRAGCADVALSITGVAGPGGGTDEKPVGTVWIAAALPDRTDARLFRLAGTRHDIRERAAQAALDMLRRLLLSQPAP